MKAFRYLEHTADIGLRLSGNSLQAVFQNAAEGLYALALMKKPGTISKKISFQFQGSSPGELLVHFLEELLYYLYTHKLAAVDLTLRLVAPACMKAEGGFGKVKPDAFTMEVKSPTYHRLSFKKTRQGYQASVYFDL